MAKLFLHISSYTTSFVHNQKQSIPVNAYIKKFVLGVNTKVVDKDFSFLMALV